MGFRELQNQHSNDVFRKRESVTSARSQGYTAFVCIVLLMRVCEIAGGKMSVSFHYVSRQNTEGYEFQCEKSVFMCVCVLL